MEKCIAPAGPDAKIEFQLTSARCAGTREGRFCAHYVDALQRILPTSWQHNLEYRSALSGSFHRNFTTMILHDLLHHRQSQASAVLLAVADERMKQALGNGISNARTIVGDRNRDGAANFRRSHLDVPLRAGSGFAGVQQQVVEGAL